MDWYALRVIACGSRPQAVPTPDMETTVEASVEAFHADLSVEITVDGAHHWRRAWSKSFARELL